MIELRPLLVCCVALTTTATPLAVISAEEPDKPPKRSAHLVPETFSKWTIMYANVSYIKGEHVATIESSGNARFHSTFHSARPKDVEVKFPAEDAGAIYQATREFFNGYHF